MSDFATGLLLGGGNIFGESSGGGGGGIDFAARNVNKKLKAEAEDLNEQITQLNEQAHHLKTEATSVDTLADQIARQTSSKRSGCVATSRRSRRVWEG